MYVREVTVQNQVGLHARPATFFIQKANEFKASIWIEPEVNPEHIEIIESQRKRLGTKRGFIAVKSCWAFCLWVL